MSQSLTEVEAVVKAAICSVCPDHRRDGSCGLEPAHPCTLFREFPNVVRIIQSTRTGDAWDYVAAMRREVCSRCAEQSPDGSCELRSSTCCPLDAYLLLIVETVEEALLHRRQGLPAKPRFRTAGTGSQHKKEHYS